ncbi:uncharacterized protein (DUF302 family) [Salsuginibacillus halophilus]|uniref:Uncharacterized protein (DUF302 family) n=1 Tax=Salsuginibacillus halophilus TaxID=517424 RepID=A0A2P8H8E3_9BACI|nr:DUF302 domain-containing protein [Salsuginibacillus halophilus]PSL42450.1 uncharacterized protein (DUF302 family) [Salsuginibacillus halophilus]
MIGEVLQTKKPLEEVAASVEEELKANQFGVLWQLDIHEKLTEKEISVDEKYRVLEVCNPVEAKSILDEDPRAVAFLPCKVVLYTENDHTYVTMPRPTALFHGFESDKIAEVAQTVEDRMAASLKKALA